MQQRRLWQWQPNIHSAIAIFDTVQPFIAPSTKNIMSGDFRNENFAARIPPAGSRARRIEFGRTLHHFMKHSTARREASYRHQTSWHEQDNELPLRLVARLSAWSLAGLGAWSPAVVIRLVCSLLSTCSDLGRRCAPSLLMDGINPWKGCLVQGKRARAGPTPPWSLSNPTHGQQSCGHEHGRGHKDQATCDLSCLISCDNVNLCCNVSTFVFTTLMVCAQRCHQYHSEQDPDMLLKYSLTPITVLIHSRVRFRYFFTLSPVLRDTDLLLSLRNRFLHLHANLIHAACYIAHLSKRVLRRTYVFCQCSLCTSVSMDTQHRQGEKYLMKL